MLAKFIPQDALLLRIGRNITVRGECVLWNGSKDKDGYAVLQVSGYPSRMSRAVLEAKLERPIKAGMLALHSCDNPSCVNPLHLREGTQSENIREAFAKGRKISPQQNSVKTRCPHGHPYDEVNTYWHRAKRHCRICIVAAKARYRAKVRSERVH